ncbi:MAG: hypothetical protein U0132_23850 [Gemmatimonadaceae bacterium]
MGRSKGLIVALLAAKKAIAIGVIAVGGSVAKLFKGRGKNQQPA